MGLLTRMATLVKADAHGVVDSIEDRSLLLKQHLREAEAELHRKQARQEAVVTEDKECREATKRLGAEMKRLEADVALAMEGDKEELARFAVRKLLALERRAEQLELRGRKLREESEELENELQRQEGELSELRVRVKSFLARSQAGEEDPHFAEPVVEEEEVELELLRRRREQKKQSPVSRKGGAS